MMGAALKDARLMRSILRRDFLALLGGSFFAAGTNGIVRAEGRVDPVFFGNYPDDNHCLQASLMMVLNTLDHPVQWDDVNAATEYQDGFYTWSIQGAAALAKYIPGVKLCSGFDYKRFATEGVAYLQRRWPRNWFEVQKEHASPGFVREQKAAAAFVASSSQQQALSSDALFDALKEYLIVPLAQTDILYPGGPIGGHFILLYASDGDAAWIHDPGLPPYQAKKIPKKLIYLAGAYEQILIPHGGRKFGPVGG
jgi:hypothetical protein